MGHGNPVIILLHFNCFVKSSPRIEISPVLRCHLTLLITPVTFSHPRNCRRVSQREKSSCRWEPAEARNTSVKQNSKQRNPLCPHTGVIQVSRRLGSLRLAMLTQSFQPKYQINSRPAFETCVSAGACYWCVLAHMTLTRYYHLTRVLWCHPHVMSCEDLYISMALVWLCGVKHVKLALLELTESMKALRIYWIFLCDASERSHESKISRQTSYFR